MHKAEGEVEKEAGVEIAEMGICDSLEVMADGVPVCGVVRFMHWAYEHFFDMS